MSIPKLPPVRKSITPPALQRYSGVEEVEKLESQEFFQHGRAYLLHGSSIPHQLPAPSKLRPFMDRKAGTVETWPASKDTSLSQPQPEAQSATKPKLLQKLESYLHNELRVLGCHDEQTPSEKRMQTYREVFDYVIENFRTYKPLLSSIKQEYESLLSSQKDTIKSLEPLKRMLVNMNEQCEQKILQMKQDEKQELLEMKKENKRLENTIASLSEENYSLQQQVKKCQTEIGVEYQKYRDEVDSRKLLLQDINDLRYQHKELKEALSGNSETEEGKKEDTVILKIALNKAREELSSKTQKLTEVLSDYGDVVPRRDFEQLEKQLKILTDDLHEVKKNNGQLLKEHSALIDVHKKVIEQRDDFAQDCERMRQSATPRPDWSKCGVYVEGGFERWNNLSNETSTNEKLDLLLAELTGQDIAVIKAGGGIIDYFEPKGTDGGVPAYLRSTERVRNRRLNKRDLLIILKDVWIEKMNDEGPHPFTKNRSKMADYLHSYLKKRFGVDTMVTEWGYNLHDAMSRYSFDLTVAIFCDILNGELEEDIHYMQLSRLEDLFKAILKYDVEETGSLGKDDLEKCLRSHFHFLTSDEVNRLVESVVEDVGELQDDGVSYKDLFTEDDEGKMGPFVNAVLHSYETDKEKIIQELELVFEKKPEISQNDLRSALVNIDSKFEESKDILDSYVSSAFRESSQESMDKLAVLKNLRRSCLGHL